MSTTGSPVLGPSALSNGKAAFFPRDAVDLRRGRAQLGNRRSLVLKFLVSSGMATGRRIATELGLPFRPFPEFLRQLKNQQFLAYADSSSANDYVYSLTDSGVHGRECTSTNAPTSDRRPCRLPTTSVPSRSRRSRPSIPRNQISGRRFRTS